MRKAFYFGGQICEVLEGLARGYWYNVVNQDCGSCQGATRLECCMCNGITANELMDWANDNPEKAAKEMADMLSNKYDEYYNPDNFICVKFNHKLKYRDMSPIREKVRKMRRELENSSVWEKENEKVKSALCYILEEGRCKTLTPLEKINYEKEFKLAYDIYELEYYLRNRIRPDRFKKTVNAPWGVNFIYHKKDEAPSDRYTEGNYLNDMNSMMGINGYGCDDIDTWETQDPHQLGRFTMYDGGWD